MRADILTVLAISTAFFSSYVQAADEPVCQVTAWDGDMLGDPFPEENIWYGSEALATVVPKDGIWPITADRALIAVKSFWWSPGYEPGMESNFTVTVENLFDSSKVAHVSRVTNAGEMDGDKWYMLVGIDIPHVGCWRVTGSYLGQELTFVVKSIDFESTE
ncbi:MAG: hypothetical protein OER97_05810 [Gammaproteobacteria bacterium]|nr:hypothetical protein [Gammaproteobacteria bacterium]